MASIPIYKSTKVEAIQHPVEIVENAISDDISTIKGMYDSGQYTTVGSTSRGVRINLTDTKEHYFAMSFSEPKEVHYFNRVKRMSLPTIGSKIIVQSLVWKSKDSNKYHCHGLPSEVMTKFMLTGEQQLGSDIMQTPEGKYFWTSLVEDLLETAEPDLFVYLYDKRYAKPNLHELTYKDDVSSLHIWGSKEEMRKVRLIISRTKLGIK